MGKTVKVFLITFLLITVLFAVSAYAALVTRYVNTASVGGDGTTNAESGANAAYASLNAWAVAESTDLVTAGDSHIVYCSTGSGTVADTTPVVISGWTTDSTHTLTIEQAASDAHGGKYNTSVYRLEATDPGTLIDVQVNYLTIRGIQWKVTYTAHWQYGLRVGTAVTNILVEQVIGWASGGNYVSPPFDVNASGSSVTLRNSLLILESQYNHGSCAPVVLSYGTLVVQNVTAIGGYYGFSTAVTTITVTNSITRGAIVGFSGTFATASDYNSSGTSGDAPNTGGSGNDNTASPWYSGATADADIFIDAANDDYHLVSGATIFDSVGANLYSTFTDDYEGDARPNSAFDLGADEYVSVGGSNPAGLFMVIN